VVIVDTNAITSCGDQSGGGCVVVLISSAPECGTVNGLHRPLRLQGSSECGFHSSFAAVATFEGDTAGTRFRKKGELSSTFGHEVENFRLIYIK
jgi:hypothetical protein